MECFCKLEKVKVEQQFLKPLSEDKCAGRSSIKKTSSKKAKKIKRSTKDEASSHTSLSDESSNGDSE